MEMKEISMPTKYDPASIEKGRYDWWLEGKFLRQSQMKEKALYNRNPASKCNR